MKIILNLLRYIIISFEFIICLTGFALWLLFPDNLVSIGIYIHDKRELFNSLVFLAAALLIYDLKLVKGIIFPDSDKKYIFQKWNLYNDFRMGCFVAVFYSLIFTLLGPLCLLFDWAPPKPSAVIFLYISSLGSTAVTASLYLSQIKIEELFRTYSNQS